MSIPVATDPVSAPDPHGVSVVVIGTEPTARKVQQRLCDSAQPQQLRPDMVAVEGVIALSVPRDLWALDSALNRLGTFDWLFLLSKPAAQFVVWRLQALHLTVPTGSRPKVATVGEGTAEVACDLGFEVVYTGTGTAADLIRDLNAQSPLSRNHILVPRSALGDLDGLAVLTKLGAEVEQVVAYENCPLPLRLDRWRVYAGRDRGVIVAVLSGSALSAVVDQLPRDILAALKQTARVVAMGPNTATIARDLGFTVVRTAIPPTLPSLCQGVLLELDTP